MPQFDRRWLIYLAFPAAVGLLYFAVLGDIRTDPERQASAAVCDALAAEVKSGAASRFDYMATRCPARLLSVAEDR